MRNRLGREPLRRGLITLGLLAAYACLHKVPALGVDLSYVQEMTRRGLAFGHRRDFAIPHLLPLGVVPYIVASVIVTSFLAVSRRREDEGEPRFPVGLVTVILALLLAVIQAHAEVVRWWGVDAGSEMRLGFRLSVVMGVALAILLAQAISRWGIGNGLCLLYGLDILDSQLAWPLTEEGRLVPLLSESGITLALILAGTVVGFAVLMVARWRPHGLRRDALSRLAGGPPLSLIGVGNVGIALAFGLMAIPVSLLMMLRPELAGSPVVLAMTRPGPVHAAVFVLLATVVSATITAWAFDPAGIRALLRRWYGDAGAADPPVVTDLYDRGLERTLLPVACLLAVGAYLFWAAVERLDAPWFSAAAVAAITAIVLDTRRQWRIHVEAERRSHPGEGGAFCDPCGAEVAEAAVFCSTCGSCFVAGRPCPRHADREVLAGCVVCGAELCEICWDGGRRPAVCTRHRDTDFVEGWAVAVAARTGLEATFLRERLAKHDMDAIVLANTSGPLYGAPGLFDINATTPLLVHRECGGGAILVLVRPSCLEAARAKLAPWQGQPALATRSQSRDGTPGGRPS